METGNERERKKGEEDQIDEQTFLLPFFRRQKRKKKKRIRIYINTKRNEYRI